MDATRTEESIPPAGPKGKSGCIAVIPTFNRPELLAKCLASLQAQTLSPDEILVVDNGGERETRDMLSRDFPGVSYLRLPENSGPAGGFGAGIKEGISRGHEWIWIMDDDSEADPDCLRILVEASGTLPDDAIVVAPLVMGLNDGKVQQMHRGFYSPVRQIQVHVKNLEAGIRPIGYCSWLGLLLRSAMVRDVDPPRTDFFMWWDDTEYSLRLGKAGPIYLVPQARIFHADQTTSLRHVGFPPSQYYKIYYGVRNRLLILRTHERWRLRRALGYLIGIYRTLRAGLSIALFRPPGARLRIRLLAWGLVDGLRGRTGKVIDPVVWAREHAEPR